MVDTCSFLSAVTSAIKIPNADSSSQDIQVPVINLSIMKSGLDLTSGPVRSIERSLKLYSGITGFGTVAVRFHFSLRAAEATNSLEIQYVNVAGRSLPFQGKESVSLGPFPENIVFGFGQDTNAGQPPLRLRYTLEGYENVWHEAGSEMAFNVRFYNNSGDQISQNIYGVTGESTGWTGSLKSSSLTHRRETLIVPPQATRLMIVISSAGPPDAVGIYVVANLVVFKSSGNPGNIPLLQSPFEE